MSTKSEGDDCIVAAFLVAILGGGAIWLVVAMWKKTLKDSNKDPKTWLFLIPLVFVVLIIAIIYWWLFKRYRKIELKEQAGPALS